MNRLKRWLVPVLCTVACLAVSSAESPSKDQGELYETIARMDSTIFGAFNGHDVRRLWNVRIRDGLAEGGGFPEDFAGAELRAQAAEGEIEEQEQE